MAAPYLLAMHSSSETLGVAALDIRETPKNYRISTFPVGRRLSNCLLNCVEEILPASSWSQLGRLAVATGPGGFTGNRLTVVMARALAQQLGCSLDGISSFSLMAPRLANALSSDEFRKPFWVVKSLHRRGLVGGRYLLEEVSGLKDGIRAIELEAPYLLPSGLQVMPALSAKDDVAADVAHLIELSALSHQKGEKSCWTGVLPIYPTSPVGQV